MGYHAQSGVIPSLLLVFWYDSRGSQLPKRANKSATQPVPDMPIQRFRNRGRRDRACLDCGRVESVRADNPGIRCRKCGARPGGLKSGGMLAAAAHRVKCSGCGATFNRQPAHTTVENFCTPECRARTRNVDRLCKQCGVSFQVWRVVALGKTNARGKFCSLDCYHVWLLAGAEAKSHYIQIKGFRRDAVVSGKVCQRCGTSSTTLEVHHVIPRRIGGMDDPSNLVPLCRHCHGVIECITRDLIMSGTMPDAIATALALEFPFAAERKSAPGALDGKA